jgi:hypothetical protein
MKLQIEYNDACRRTTYESDDDCRRVDYCVTVDGKEYCLSGSALGNEHNDREATERARELFGPDVELIF